jgi:HlyD family secretion protein
MRVRRSRTTTLILILLGVVAIAFVLAARGVRDNVVAVSTTRASRHDLSSWIATNGKVEPIEPHVIQAQLTTFIDSVSVKEGQTVGRGQTLMQVDARDLTTELARMKEQLVAAQDDRRVGLAGGSPDEIAQLDNDLARTNSEIERLQNEFDSTQRLFAKQAATKQELDQTKTALGRAESDKRLITEKRSALVQRSQLQAERAALRIDEATNAIRSLDEKLNGARILAPAAGTIYSLAARVGAYVHTGDVLAEMADLRRVQVRVFVDEPELGSLNEGAPVEITWDALPGRTWAGQVEQLPRTVVARGSRNVGEVLCSVGNGESELLPNTNVNVRVRTGLRGNVLALSRAAVRTEGGMHYVFVVDRGRLHKQEVQLGISNATDYEVLSGITENDVIALPGASELQEGMAVTIAA